jgi:hypothetical protein
MHNPNTHETYNTICILYTYIVLYVSCVLNSVLNSVNVIHMSNMYNLPNLSPIIQNTNIELN